MSSTEKRKVKISVAELSPSELRTSAIEAIKTLRVLVTTYGPTVHIEYGQHDRYSDASSYMAYAYRDETDEELAARLQQEHKQLKLQQEQQIRLLHTQAAALGFDLTPKA